MASRQNWRQALPPAAGCRRCWEVGSRGVGRVLLSGWAGASPFRAHRLPHPDPSLQVVMGAAGRRKILPSSSMPMAGVRSSYGRDLPSFPQRAGSHLFDPAQFNSWLRHWLQWWCSWRRGEAPVMGGGGGVGEERPFNFLQVLCEGVIAGGAAGVVVETALYPIDTIKTRLQAVRAGSPIQWKGLYSGLGGNIAGVLPASALFVGVYEPTKQKLLDMFPENLSAVAHLTAGAVGGFAASLIRVPTEVVKQRMQTGQFRTAPDAVRLIVAKEGFKGLYAGYGSFLLRDLPFDAIQFCIYEQLRIGYKLVAKRELNDPENALIGAFAGAITGAITTPLDVLKTRLMIQGQTKQYSGIVSCAKTILREEGPGAFLRGIEPRVLWIGIGGSIFFGVLEKTKSVLAERSSRKAAAEKDE